MNDLNNRKIDYFTRRMFELYEVTENHARFLFDRWHVIDKGDEASIRAFIESDDVKKIFFIQPNINIVKKYSLAELNKIGIQLIEVDKENHIFRDSKNNFLWEEIYHGMADCWSGLYKIKEPAPDDKHLL